MVSTRQEKSGILITDLTLKIVFDSHPFVPVSFKLYWPTAVDLINVSELFKILGPDHSNEDRLSRLAIKKNS